MRFLIYFVIATVVYVSVVHSRQLIFGDDDTPVFLVESSYGKYGAERVNYVEAVIRPHHVNNNGQLNYPADLDHHFVIARGSGDERGHLVAAQFSGPAEWYNLTPQSPRVNRHEDYQAIDTDWYRAECKVRNFLTQGENRYVNWRVRMNYVTDSNRPNEYHLSVNFMENGKNKMAEIDILIRNKFLVEDKTFWVCSACGTIICKSLLVISE